MNRSSNRKQSPTRAKRRVRRPGPRRAELLAQLERWKQLVQSIADEVWFCDAQGRMSLLNHPEIIHIGLEKFEHQPVEQLLKEIEVLQPDGQPRPPEMSPLLRSLRGEVVRGEEIMRHRVSGRTRWRQYSSAPLRNRAGKITGAVAVAWDITEHKHEDQALSQLRARLEARVQERTAQLEASLSALAESEERYHGLFQSISDAIVVTDLETLSIVDVNDAACGLYGYSREEFLRLNTLALSTAPAATAAAIEQVRAGKPHRVPFRTHQRKDQSVFPVEICGSLFAVQGRPMLCSVIRDLSERRQLEQELVRISERERQRIACDLHDGLGQQLVAIAFGVHMLQKRLRSRPEARELRQLGELLDGAITDARRLSRGLQPVQQQPEGLMGALQQLALTASGLFRLRCRFECPKPVLMADDRIANHLFRIAQEAVTNAHRHGQASQVVITLRQQRKGLTLSVQDNGLGLSQSATAPGGMGLRIMKHRADLIGGSLLLEPAAKRGVRVACTLPKPNAESSPALSQA